MNEIKRELRRLGNRPLAEIRARFTELTGETNRSPNKTFLLRRIREALEARRATAASSAPAAAPRPRRAWKDLTIEQLQALYLEKVGRPTDSEDRPYLMWKIRQAVQGKVRVGPARERLEAVDQQHVPFTLPRETVTALDRARERLGFKTRQAMLHQAMHELLTARGETQVARCFKAVEAEHA